MCVHMWSYVKGCERDTSKATRGNFTKFATSVLFEDKDELFSSWGQKVQSQVHIDIKYGQLSTLGGISYKPPVGILLKFTTLVQ